MTLESASEHPHGLSDKDFDVLFTKDKPIVFAFHGYPSLIHQLTYRRTNHANLHVRGYKEEGTTTTPFDMVVMNDLDRFHLVGDVIDRVAEPRRARRPRQAGAARQADRAQGVHPALRPGHAGGARLEVGLPPWTTLGFRPGALPQIEQQPVVALDLPSRTVHQLEEVATARGAGQAHADRDAGRHDSGDAREHAPHFRKILR